MVANFQLFVIRTSLALASATLVALLIAIYLLSLAFRVGGQYHIHRSMMSHFAYSSVSLTI
jgi:hypothetical protein